MSGRLGLTPGSVAMKLSNLASLDPALKMRGIEGLKDASNPDRDVWDEFHDNPSELIPLSQERFDALIVNASPEAPKSFPHPTKQRRGQGYFRDAVLNNYDKRCAVTGFPVRELLTASHILSWSEHSTMAGPSVTSSMPSGKRT